jgi:hypothetical protein
MIYYSKVLNKIQFKSTNRLLSDLYFTIKLFLPWYKKIYQYELLENFLSANFLAIIDVILVV